MPSLELWNIRKSYTQASEDFPVLDGISINVFSGQVISILGPSGSGKSTLLQIIGLIEAPSSGLVSFDVRDINLMTDKEKSHFRLSQMGFVYQFHHLLNEFTAVENLILPQIINGFDKKQAKIVAEDLLLQFGLSSKIFNQYPAKLSGGEKQRVAIARALVNKPKLLLADEPTGNLDQHNAQNVLDLLIKQARERNLLALIVTHNADLAKQTDSIYVLDSGKIKKL